MTWLAAWLAAVPAAGGFGSRCGGGPVGGRRLGGICGVLFATGELALQIGNLLVSVGNLLVSVGNLLVSISEVLSRLVYLFPKLLVLCPEPFVL